MRHVSLVVIFVLFCISIGELQIGDIEPLRTRPELEALEFPELEACLWMREQTCKFCVGMYDTTDKFHMVNACFQHQNLPIKTLTKPVPKYREIPRKAPPGSTPTEMKKADPAYDAMMYRMRYEESEKMRKKEDAIDMLKKQGFDVSKIQKEEGEFASMERKIKEATRKQYDEARAKKEAEEKKKAELNKEIKKEEL